MSNIIKMGTFFLAAFAYGSIGAASKVFAQESITFPSRASTLATDSYWVVSEFSEGCCTLDLNVRRWDGSKWDGDNDGDENHDNYDWDVPLYAPATGYVASCWRSFPDDPLSGDHPDSDKIFAGGNRIIIRTDQGNTVHLFHLKQNSIPTSLCPSNPDGANYPTTMDKVETGAYFRKASYIARADRPRIREGQFLGRVGNSGRSGGPHMHFEMRRVLNPNDMGVENLSSSIALPLRHSWAHGYNSNAQPTPGGWFRERGQGFSEDGEFKMLHSSPYLRRTHYTAGHIKSSLDTIFITSNRAVTASILSSDKFKLIAWDLAGVTNIVRKGEVSSFGAVQDVKIVEPASNYVLAATILPDQRLKMIAYHVNAGGDFQRVDSWTAGKVTKLDMALTSGPDSKAVTAVRLENGNLKMIAWDVEVNNQGQASIVRLGEQNAGAVSTLSVSRSRHFNGVYTAVRTSGTLRVIPWKLSDNGMTFERRAHASAGAIGPYIDVAAIGQGVAAAFEDSNGNFRIITWPVSAAGDLGNAEWARVAGGTKEIKLLEAPHGDSNLTAVMRGDDDNLYLIGWAMESNGSKLRRVGSSKAGDITGLSADVMWRSFPGLDPRDNILTGVRLTNGDLRLILWDVNLNNP